METYKIYAGGKFLDTSGTLKITRPYDSELFAETGLAGPGELEMAIRMGLAAEKEMRNLPVYQRSKILSQIAGQMQEQRHHLATLLCQEAGKPLRYALVEVDRAIQTFRIAAEEAKRIPGEYINIDWTPSGEGKEGWVKYFPIGLIGAISPFNFPLNLSAHKIAPALAAGNPIILKPASQTPVTVLELARIMAETDLPPGAVSILPMSRENGNKLVTDPRIKLITFTGSPEVGWRMKEQAGRKRVVLELGGNAGVLISSTADLDAAAAKCVAGGFAYSGQVCIHVQRIFVIDAHFQEFTTKMIALTGKLKAGDPLDPATDISVMIDETNALRVEKWIGEAISGGARVLTGGHRKGNYFEPTLITNTTAAMKVRSCEAFGPVVTIEPVPDFDEGIRRINDSVYGLQAGIFTNNLAEVDQAFRELEVGGVIINDVPSFRADHMPYGGVKESGFGREGVKYAMYDMMELRLLVKNK